MRAGIGWLVCIGGGDHLSIGSFPTRRSSDLAINAACFPLGVLVFVLVARPVLRALAARSEEHTSELQSHVNLVCRLLPEKKNTQPFVSTFQEDSGHEAALRSSVTINYLLAAG